MIKCFLSHSSRDKDSYVRLVANKLGQDKCVYDEYTFEPGMKALDEILKGLDKSKLFVLFLSDSALESKWVKQEITEAYQRFEIGDIKKIFPIIIDENISHRDNRIPQWMKDEYNLKYVSRPNVAARRIIQRLREISWNLYPDIQKRQKIFVGRNKQIQVFEERIDNIEKPQPTCIVASGIPEIGRRTLLRHCCIKSNVIDESYQSSVIVLNYQDSIEDFIIKIYDLGLTREYSLINLMTTTVSSKISIAIEIIKDIQASREIISILDHGCIVTHDKEISSWFGQILNSIKNNNQLTFSIASRYRLSQHKLYDKPEIFSISVSELDRGERIGLFKRYANFEKLNIQSDDLTFFSNLFTGYPKQIYYTIDLIKEEGIFNAKKNKNIEAIRDFSNIQAQKLLENYTQSELQFIHFLSEFDFISYSLIFEIVNENERFHNLIAGLISSSICENIGANKEFVKMNDAIRDYIRRGRIGVSEYYRNKLKHHTKKFLETYISEEKDISDYFYSLKKALLEHEQVDSSFLIPSHFLRTMKEVYDSHHQYEDVVLLANRVLENEEFLDPQIIAELRNYLCLSLARLSQKEVKFREKFREEVFKINNSSQHNFLFGFFYRLQGKPAQAKEKFRAAIESGNTNIYMRANREMVEVLLNLEEYEEALNLAQKNYEEYPSNPFHIQAYFRCLVNSKQHEEKTEILEQLVEGLKIISRKNKADKTQEILAQAQAEFMLYKNEELSTILEHIDQHINLFPNYIYLQISRFDASFKFRNVPEVNKSYFILQNSINSKSNFYKYLISAKCIVLGCIEKNQHEVSKLINAEFRNYPDSFKQKLRQKIENWKDEN